MRKWITLFFTPSAWDVVNWLQIFFPFLAGGGTALLGVSDQMPLMWIVVAAALVFASTAIGIVGYRLYIFQRDPEHKLRFNRILVSRDGNIITIGFEVHNDAVFPIEISIVEFHTSCARRISHRESRWLNRKVLVDPGQFRFTYAENIDISGILDVVMSGQMKLTLRYGHPKRRNYEMMKDVELFIPLDPALPFQHSDRLPVDTEPRKPEHG